MITAEGGWQPWIDCRLIPLDIGEVYGRCASWVTDNTFGGSWTNQMRNARIISPSGVTFYGPVTALETFGDTPSVVEAPPFTLENSGFGTYQFRFTPSYSWCCAPDGRTFNQAVPCPDTVYCPNTSVTYPLPTLTPPESPLFTFPGTTISGITINGTGLGTPDVNYTQYRGITSVNVSGTGVATSFTPANVPATDFVPPSANSFELEITVESNATPGTRQISATVFGHLTNSIPFTVPDNTPIIDYIEQQSLQSGGEANIAIHGSNFGAPCPGNLPCPGAGIAVCRIGESPCQSSDVNPTVTWWSDNGTQINARLNAAVTASGYYDMQVTSAGVGGLGFAPAPGTRPTTSKSNTKPIVVSGNPNLTLRVTSNGNPLSSASCAYIEPVGPSMPQIAARVESIDQSPVTGNATWQIVTTFTWKNRDVATGATWDMPEANSIPSSPTQPMPGNQWWNPPLPTNLFGGNAVLKWTYDGQAQEPFKFKICGQNPDFASVENYIENAAPYWYAKKIAIHETNISQFCEQGRQQSPSYCSKPENFGMPVFGPPAGYGIFQKDPAPSVDMLWNWRTAVEKGRDHMNATAGPAQYVSLTDGRAYPFWVRQVRQWNLYNDLRTANQQPATAPPADQVETPDATFTLPLDANGKGLESSATGRPNTYWFGDAVLIKQFGGAITPVWSAAGTCVQRLINANYISWNNTGQAQGITPYWSIRKENIISKNVAREVASCTVHGPPDSCTRLTQPKPLPMCN